MSKDLSTELDGLTPWFRPSKHTDVRLYVDPTTSNAAASALSASVVRIPAELRLEKAPTASTADTKVLSFVVVEQGGHERHLVQLGLGGEKGKVLGRVYADPEIPEQRLQFAREVRDIVEAASRELVGSSRTSASLGRHSAGSAMSRSGYVGILSRSEAAALVRALEEKLGVRATSGPGIARSAAAEEDVTEFSVELTASGANKINVIRAIRQITGLALGEAKALVEGAPRVIRECVTKAEADEIKKKLTDAGATVRIKPA